MYQKEGVGSGEWGVGSGEWGEDRILEGAEKLLGRGKGKGERGAC
jgi:hypothetical protein